MQTQAAQIDVAFQDSSKNGCKLAVAYRTEQSTEPYCACIISSSQLTFQRAFLWTDMITFMPESSDTTVAQLISPEPQTSKSAADAAPHAHDCQQHVSRSE